MARTSLLALTGTVPDMSKATGALGSARVIADTGSITDDAQASRSRINIRGAGFATGVVAEA
jgi:hypothetical protein